MNVLATGSIRAKHGFVVLFTLTSLECGRKILSFSQLKFAVCKTAVIFEFAFPVDLPVFAQLGFMLGGYLCFLLGDKRANEVSFFFHAIEHLLRLFVL